MSKCNMLENSTNDRFWPNPACRATIAGRQVEKSAMPLILRYPPEAPVQLLSADLIFAIGEFEDTRYLAKMR
jgi:hypothetical protein